MSSSHSNSGAYVICYPNAGLPNALGGYDECPEHTSALLAEFARDGLVNIVGGCCGTTPDVRDNTDGEYVSLIRLMQHIRAIRQQVSQHAPRKPPAKVFTDTLSLSGQSMFT